MVGTLAVAGRKKQRKRTVAVEWQGPFPKLLDDPSKDARRDGSDMAKKLLADLDKALAKEKQKKRSK